VVLTNEKSESYLMLLPDNQVMNYSVYFSSKVVGSV